jgi:hypothetical protein
MLSPPSDYPNVNSGPAAGCATCNSELTKINRPFNNWNDILNIGLGRQNGGFYNRRNGVQSNYPQDNFNYPQGNYNPNSGFDWILGVKSSRNNGNNGFNNYNTGYNGYYNNYGYNNGYNNQRPERNNQRPGRNNQGPGIFDYFGFGRNSAGNQGGFNGDPYYSNSNRYNQGQQRGNLQNGNQYGGGRSKRQFQSAGDCFNLLV